MRRLIPILLVVMGITSTHALVISEVMSNPIGTDNGREWIEIYNDSSETVDISALKLSVDENGTQIGVTPLQGGTSLPVGGYAIIATIVSGQTKFLEDYPTYSGILFRVSSSFSLTNTTASLYIKLNGSVVASLPSYAAAKEGQTLSFIGGNYIAGIPTPRMPNEAFLGTEGGNDTSTSTQTTDNQITIPQASPPSPDIVLYLPQEKTVVAGAESEFTVSSATRAGKEIADVRYVWSFGDGGYATGSSTRYRYTYNGRYVAVVEAKSATVAGQGRVLVRVVPPDIKIIGAGFGKYGAYVDIQNQNSYDLDLSYWTLVLNGAGFPFPKNTILAARAITRMSGAAMGFASSTVSASTSIAIRFPNLEEVTTFVFSEQRPLPSVTGEVLGTATSTKENETVAVLVKRNGVRASINQTTATSQPKTATTTVRKSQKDTRLVSWFKQLFR